MLTYNYFSKMHYFFLKIDCTLDKFSYFCEPKEVNIKPCKGII